MAFTGQEWVRAGGWRVVVAAEEVADALPEAALGIRRHAAGDHGDLARAFALRVGALAVVGIEPVQLQALARLRPTAAVWAAWRTGRAIRAAHRWHRTGRPACCRRGPSRTPPDAAGEAGEPAVAQVVAGAGLAGGVEPGQAGVADRMRGAVQRHLLHRPGGQAHRRLVFARAGLHFVALDRAGRCHRARHAPPAAAARDRRRRGTGRAGPAAAAPDPAHRSAATDSD